MYLCIYMVVETVRFLLALSMSHVQASLEKDGEIKPHSAGSTGEAPQRCAERYHSSCTLDTWDSRM